jgi:SPP1 gp7 family putative phage head morphogenesis protein
MPDDLAQMDTTIASYSLKLGMLWRRFRNRVPGIVASSRELAEPSVRADIFEAQIDAELERGIYAPAKRIVSGHIPMAYSQGRARSGQLMRTWNIQAPVGPGYRDADIVAALESRNMALIKGLGDETKKNMQTTLNQAIIDGKGYAETARLIRDEAEMTRARAETIARTEAMAAYSTAAKKNYAENGVSRVKWIKSRQEGVCEICEGYADQESFSIDSVPEQPAHPNCRCIIVPVRTDNNDDMTIDEAVKIIEEKLSR